MKRTILSLLVAGLFAGIGTSAIAEDAAAQPAANEQAKASSGTEATMSPTQTNPAKADVAPQTSGTDGSKPATKKTKDY